MIDFPSGELMTLTEIATELGVNPSTVRLWVREQRLPAQKVGRKWLVSRLDLETMLENEPRIGQPRTSLPGGVTPTDWSEIPEQATLNLASSTQLIREVR
jgi:excisionase family DNA binding protein